MNRMIEIKMDCNLQEMKGMFMSSAAQNCVIWTLEGANILASFDEWR